MAHRLELVGEVGGVRFVNDSKATNVAAARKALEAYSSEPVHLILGGSLKGEDFGPLAAAIGDNVRSVHLIGQASDELAAALGAARTGATRRSTAPSRTRRASRAPGDVVLLSPACASYDQFENFERRGDEFRRLVTTLTLPVLGIKPPGRELDRVRRESSSRGC